MPHGHVKRVVAEHGFGFLVDDAGLDWFFTRAGVRNDVFAVLQHKTRVVFSPEWTPQGPRAGDIHIEHSE